MRRVPAEGAPGSVREPGRPRPGWEGARGAGRVGAGGHRALLPPPPFCRCPLELRCPAPTCGTRAQGTGWVLRAGCWPHRPGQTSSSLLRARQEAPAAQSFGTHVLVPATVSGAEGDSSALEGPFQCRAGLLPPATLAGAAEAPSAHPSSEAEVGFSLRAGSIRAAQHGSGTRRHRVRYEPWPWGATPRDRVSGACSALSLCAQPLFSALAR